MPGRRPIAMLRALLNIDPRILATSLAFLVVALGLLARRRVVLARIRARRLAQQEAETSDGETSVMPLAQLASAVEVLDLDDLLAGEEVSVVAAARRQLEAPTDVNVSPDTFFPLSAAPPTRPGPSTHLAPTTRPGPATHPALATRPAPAMRPAVATAPRMISAAAPAVALADRARKVAAMAAEAGGAAKTERAVPVRELALAWFEARGYRASSASLAVRPIELVLRHRKDPGRAYAFIVERERVTSDRVAALVEHANSIGLTRLLVAAESGIEPDTRKRFRREGVRLVDQYEMRREFDKLDLRVAAKIIAVARSRARLRTEAK
jgi:hypothetical protein